MKSLYNQIGIFAPARLNSQRLPNKQILPIGNSCMFEICCKKLDYIKTQYGINTYVLICDDELINIAKKYPNIQIIIRDIETTKVDAPLRYIYKDVLNLKEKYLMFFNPCLIFLTPETILNKIKEFIFSGKNYATSVKKFHNWLWDDNDNQITDINFKELNTKDITPWYQAAHCFHIFNREKFKEDGFMLKDDLVLLEIPIEETIDIDTREDYEYAKWKWEIQVCN